MLQSANTEWAVDHTCQTCGNKFVQLAHKGAIEYKQYFCSKDKMLMYPEWIEVEIGIKFRMGLVHGNHSD